MIPEQSHDSSDGNRKKMRRVEDPAPVPKTLEGCQTDALISCKSVPSLIAALVIGSGRLWLAASLRINYRADP